MKAKLNKAQAQKLSLIKNYFSWYKTNGYGNDPQLWLAENNSTFISIVTNIYNNNSGLHLVGCDWRYKQRTESITPNCITTIFSAAKKDDDTFVYYLKTL